MTEPKILTTIDYLTHSKVRIAADAATLWPHIVDTSGWQHRQGLVHIGGEPGCVGEQFHAVASSNPEVPLFHVENVELISQRRRTIRLTDLDGIFLGFSTWELTQAGDDTIVAYDTYCRGPLLPPNQTRDELIANAQRSMDERILGLRTLIEGSGCGPA